MREGLTERGIWFAGEHVSPFVALGTVTGAWWSGEGVAGRIAGAYGVGVVEEGDEGIEKEGEEGSKEVNFRSFGDDGTGGSSV